MPTVLALISDPDSRADIARAVRPHGVVRFCEVVAQLWPEIAIGDVVAVVADPFDADDRSTGPSLAELRRALPTVPVIVRDPSTDHLGSTLANFILTARPQNPARIILDALDSTAFTLPPLAAAYVRHVIQHARAGLRVADALVTLDRSKRRSLDRQLSDTHVPTAQALIGWSFALHTTWYWSFPTHTFESVATFLGFPEAKALRGVITNHVGSPRDLMRQGGFPRVLDRFLRVLQGDWSSERRPRRGDRPPP